jgi:uncharacterized protein with HEPN domain
MKSKHPERIPEYLQHILDAINRALGYVAAMNVESFSRVSNHGTCGRVDC